LLALGFPIYIILIYNVLYAIHPRLAGPSHVLTEMPGEGNNKLKTDWLVFFVMACKLLLIGQTHALRPSIQLVSFGPPLGSRNGCGEPLATAT
jgi:hypothetical protein